MKKNIFIIVPSFNNDSPVKGAAILANYLSKIHKVYFVSINSGKSKNNDINKNIDQIDLSVMNKNIYSKLKYLKNRIQNEDKNTQTIVISYCLISDIFNFFLKIFCRIYTISSLRANLYKDYYYLFGIKGYILAIFHFVLLKRVDLVIVMSKSMSDLVRFYKIRNITIPNFINEHYIDKLDLEYVRKSDDIKYKVSFVGNLTKRKCIFLLIRAFEELLKENSSLELHIVGDGPERIKCVKYIKSKKLEKNIFLYKELSNPFYVLSQTDLFVLPSMSEGISRAVMEALYIGIPVVIRDIDGNKELIQDNNGKLFLKDNEIKSAISNALKLKRKIKNNQKKVVNLLPKKFSYDNVTSQYKRLISSI